jgi:HD-like signal output (HDOD) protein
MNPQAIVDISPAVLSGFVPMREWDENQLKTLTESTQVEHVSPGTRIIQRGSTDHWTFYLLEGRLELEAVDGAKKIIEGGTSAAMNPLAQLKPRQYNVTSLSAARVLRIESEKLNRVSPPHAGAGIDVGGADKGIQDVEQGGLENQLYCDIYRALVQDALVLPSLPEVAIRIRELVDREDVSANQVSKVVQSDSGISAKLVKAANSALYAGAAPVDSLSQALVRLGMKTTSELVLCFAVRELFQTQSRVLKERMQALWRHSAQVAALSYVLAQKLPGFDPERALLMGLVHDIGVVAILNYLDKYPEVADDAQRIEQIVRRLRGEISGLILRKWNFPEDFVITALEAEDWNRDPDSVSDYCDLVIIAQIHGFIGTPAMLTVPPLNQLPAFKKLALGHLTPRMGLELLDQAKEKIDEVVRMLAL